MFRVSIVVLGAPVAALTDLPDEATPTVWRSPDERPAGLTLGCNRPVGRADAGGTNLCARGMGLRPINVVTDGLLQVTAPGGAVGNQADLT
jgi:NitT/TauT family transport system substrate-binding protein